PAQLAGAEMRLVRTARVHVRVGGTLPEERLAPCREALLDAGDESRIDHAGGFAGPAIAETEGRDRRGDSEEELCLHRRRAGGQARVERVRPVAAAMKQLPEERQAP